MLKLGCAERVIQVPLFAELYGYGPYADRKNLGVHDPLYCRAFSFNDGVKRAMVIYSDVCSTDDNYAREIRSKIATKFKMEPDGIAFIATHTHSAPALSTQYASPVGVAHPEFQENWKRVVMEAAEEALKSEEDIATIRAGKAPLDKAVGKNRVHRDENPTDSSIRWIQFIKADGTVKVLLHNHAAHGTCNNGELRFYASADWMGAVNRVIKERGLAEMPLYMQGAAGNMNTRISVMTEKSTAAADIIANDYVDYLQRDFDKGVELKPGEISFALKAKRFPVKEQTAEELRQDAADFRTLGVSQAEKDYWAVNARRLDEMALLLEKGEDLGVMHDFQVIRIGGIEMLFIPGELYLQPGNEILAKAKCEFPVLATLANGDGAYYFTEDTAKRYPTPKSIDAGPVFGFYEIYGYMHWHHFKYADNIADFIVSSLLEM